MNQSSNPAANTSADRNASRVGASESTSGAAAGRDGPRDAWWGTFAVPLGGTGYWRVGTLRWWAQRFEHEWRIAWHSGEDPNDRSVTIEVPSADSPPAEAQTHRFGFAASPELLVVSPALADRPVVIRPEMPFRVLPGERATLYFTTPLWVRFGMPGRSAQLLEVSTSRPSDTWFGPSTRTGELCYASRTRASLSLGAVAQTPGRAVTIASVHNEADDAVLLERINLPLPHLALWRDAEGRHWTQSVEIHRRKAGADSQVRLSQGAPQGCRAATSVCAARQAPPRGSILHAFASLIS